LSVSIHEAELASLPSSQTIDPAATSPRTGEDADAFAPGSLVGGKFRIERKLGEGGIGVIVLATHVALNQHVAIKYLKPRALRDAKVVDRFEREARLAAQIASEHVVRVHDVGRDPKAGPYMVMEYLVGRDLWQTLDKGPLTIPRAIDYLLQACDALAEAHALRIIHRDIKPENMFLAERPSNTPIVKIIDFGISKAAPKRGEGGAWARQTQADERFGTPVYMSPEQLRASSNVDARTDIWSLGVSLFEMLTAELPFDGDDVPQLCTSILTAQPRRLRELRAGAPEALEQVILKCLEKDARMRYRNVAELAQELVPFATPESARRVERIRQVTRRAGDSIRPPTPMPGTLVLPLVPDLAAPSTISATVQAVGEDPSATATPPVRGASRVARFGIVAGVIGAALIAAVIGTVEFRDRRASEPPHPPPVVAAAPPPAVAQSATRDTASVTPSAVASAIPAAPQAAAPSPAPSPIVKATPRSSATGPRPVAPAAPPARAADPREQFGERQ
jgi:serine/threonine protein kinase